MCSVLVRNLETHKVPDKKKQRKQMKKLKRERKNSFQFTFIYPKKTPRILYMKFP